MLRSKGVGSNKGSGLLQLIVPVAMGGALMYLIAGLSTQGTKGEFRSSVLMSADLVSENLQAMLKNPEAWEKTLHGAENGEVFNCLLKNSNCTGKGGVFSIRNAADTVFYDPRNSNSGFTVSGDPCTSFSTSDACPLRYDVRWEPRCQDSACTNPKVRLIGSARYQAALQDRKIALSSEKHGFDFERTDAQSTGASGGSHFYTDQPAANEFCIIARSGGGGFAGATQLMQLEFKTTIPNQPVSIWHLNTIETPYSGTKYSFFLGVDGEEKTRALHSHLPWFGAETQVPLFWAGTISAPGTHLAQVRLVIEFFGRLDDDKVILDGNMKNHSCIKGQIKNPKTPLESCGSNQCFSLQGDTTVPAPVSPRFPGSWRLYVKVENNGELEEK